MAPLNLTSNEVMVLECLAESKEPVGSLALVDRLNDKGITASSATVGRVLFRLESMGYLYKVSNQGRCISDDGKAALSEFYSMKALDESQRRLSTLITSSSLDNYINILYARRAVERECARLAAVNITDLELRHLEETLKKQGEYKAAGRSIAEIDVEFHRSIAKASRNQIFEVLYQVLFAHGQQSPLFEEIRAKRAHATSAHFEILDALKAHNPKRAEQSMIDHIDNLILDVEDYMHDLTLTEK